MKEEEGDGGLRDFLHRHSLFSALHATGGIPRADGMLSPSSKSLRSLPPSLSPPRFLSSSPPSTPRLYVPSKFTSMGEIFYRAEKGTCNSSSLFSFLAAPS